MTIRKALTRAVTAALLLAVTGPRSREVLAQTVGAHAPAASAVPVSLPMGPVSGPAPSAPGLSLPAPASPAASLSLPFLLPALRIRAPLAGAEAAATPLASAAEPAPESVLVPAERALAAPAQEKAAPPLIVSARSQIRALLEGIRTGGVWDELDGLERTAFSGGPDSVPAESARAAPRNGGIPGNLTKAPPRLSGVFADVAPQGQAAEDVVKAFRLPLKIPPADPEAVRQAADGFGSILLDTRRRGRAGLGDAGAYYLTALDLRRRVGYQGRIVVIVDPESASILERMAGKPLTSIAQDLGDTVFYDAERDRAALASMPDAGLYLNLTSSSGEEAYRMDFGVRLDGEAPGPRLSLPVGPKTVRFTQTVLGRTDAPVEMPHGGGGVGSFQFSLGAAGLRDDEIGIYRDPVAFSLRDKTPAEVRAFLDSALDRMPSGPGRDAVRRIAGGTRLRGARRALAYGLSSAAQKGHLDSYLRGLGRAAARGASFTLMTPSEVKLEDFSPDVRARLRIYEAGSALPERAEPGTVALVKVGLLTHEAFTALIAFSEIPPVVAGDSALSAAVAIGKPFVMTQVPWNEANVRNVAALLRRQDPARSRLIDELAQSRLEGALSASRLRAAFKGLMPRTKALTDSLLLAARAAARRAEEAPPTRAEVLSLPGFAQRFAAVARASASGGDDAVRALIEGFEKGRSHDKHFMHAVISAGLIDRRALASPRFARYVREKLLLSEDPLDRLAGIFAVGRSHPRDAVAILSGCLGDREQFLRAYVIGELGRIGTPEALAVIAAKGLKSGETYLWNVSYRTLLVRDESFKRDYRRLKADLPPQGVPFLLGMHDTTYQPSSVDLTDEFLRVLAEMYFEHPTQAVRNYIEDFYNRWAPTSALRPRLDAIFAKVITDWNSRLDPARRPSGR